jgi:iron complex transport system ATP-binding protein
MILQTNSLCIGYKKRKNEVLLIQQDLNLSVAQGEMVCLIGPNGCGKSTLIRSIAGLQPYFEGEIYVGGKAISKQNNESRAQLIGLVLTDRVDAGNLTVFDIVAIGRQPHTNWFGGLSETDRQRIREALEQVHLTSYAKSNFNELSDGEKQRVMIAKALVQDTALIILDEPTAHLDLPNRVEIMLLLRNLARQTQKAIILSTHELDLALQVADTIWLMQQNKGVIVGVPEDLILNGSFRQIFANRAFSFDEFTGNFNLNYTSASDISLSGDKKQVYWTARALSREGYRIVPEAPVAVEAHEGNRWTLRSLEKVVDFKSIKEVLDGLLELS